MNWECTSQPGLNFDKSVGKWRLKMRYTAKKKKPVGVQSAYFDTKEEAQASEDWWRLSWEQGHKGERIDAGTQPGERSADDSVPQGKSQRSLGVLNAVQSRQYKRHRFEGGELSPAEWMKSTCSSTENQTDSTMSKVAVVTGANKGIGFAIAKKLANASGHVCILTSRDRARGEQAVDDLSREGLTAIFKQLDIGDPSSVESFASQLEEEYGRCDILVNNAAIAFKASDPTPFKDQVEPTLKTNFFDTVAFTEKMLPLIRKSPAGRIVNVASMSGQLSILKSRELREAFTNPVLTKAELLGLMREFMDDVKSGQHEAKGWPSTCYGMSKLGLIAYTIITARMEAGSSVLVNSCCPGYCDTDMTSHRGHLSPEEGARTPFMLTQMENLAKGGITGGFFQREAVSRW